MVSPMMRATDEKADFTYISILNFLNHSNWKNDDEGK
jgi:hypothetical protein